MRGLKVLGVTDERSVLFLEEAFGKGHFSYATSPGAVQTVVQMNTITHGGNDIAVVQIPRRGSIGKHCRASTLTPRCLLTIIVPQRLKSGLFLAFSWIFWSPCR